MKQKTPERHDLRHPVTGKFIPRPENQLKRIIEAHKRRQAQRQALPGLARLQGILPLLMALRQGQGQPQQPMPQQPPQLPPQQ